MSSDPLKMSRGGGEFGNEIEASEVDPWFLTQLHAALKSPLFSVPKPFETWMIDKVASSGFDLPISQIIGFLTFTGQSATQINTEETTASGSYTDLATVGPQLSNLPDGQYLLMYGCTAKTSASGAAAVMSIQANSTAAADADAIAPETTVFVPGMFAVAKTLVNAGSNTVTAKYKTSGGATGSFLRRWLFALKIDNA